MAKSTDKSTDKRLKNLKPAWKEGQSGNPNGRPKGAQSFSTLYKKAIANIAASKGIDPEDFEVQLVQQAITKGFNGDKSFYSDTMDRVHGKAMQSVDHTTDGQPIQFAISSEIANKHGIKPQAEGDSK